MWEGAIIMSLFELRNFVMHSGQSGYYKIECDALTDDDWDTLAFIIVEKINFKEVYGIPSGGTKLQNALYKYTDSNSNTLLIVDDVLTTGRSIEEFRKIITKNKKYKNIIGVVVFARGKCPKWVKPIFQMW